MRWLSPLRLPVLLILQAATSPAVVDAGTSVWVMDHAPFRLVRMTTSGDVLWTRGFQQSQAIGVDPGDASVWAAEIQANTMLKVSAVGHVLRHVRDVSRPTAGGLTILPAFLAVDPKDGALWVNATQQVAKFSRAGCEQFRTSSRFDFVSSIAVDPRDSSVWVADGGGLGGRKIVKLDAAGREIFRAATGGFASNAGQQVAVDPRDGSVWYAQPFADTVIKRASDGTLIAVVPGFTQPIAVEVDATDGSVWVADALAGDVVKLDRDGGLLLRRDVGATPLAVRINPDDGSVWVGVMGALVILAPDGGVRTTVPGFALPFALAISTGPEPRLARVERFTGVATGAGARDLTADLHLESEFTVPAGVDLAASTVTVRSVFEQPCAAGELVHGLPLSPSPAPWNNSVRAGFEDRTTPNFTTLDIRKRDDDEHSLRLRIGAATIELPDACPTIPLTTTIEIHDGGATPLIVTAENLWDCLGGAVKSLRTP